MLNPGKAGHALLDSDCICSIKVPIFSCKRCKRYSEISFAINYPMVTEGFRRRTRYKMMLGWSVTMRSIHEGFLPGSKLVGSEMTWDKPKEVNISSSSLPSGVSSPSGHRRRDLPLKSPAKTRPLSQVRACVRTCVRARVRASYTPPPPFERRDSLQFSRTLSNIRWKGRLNSITVIVSHCDTIQG